MNRRLYRESRRVRSRTSNETHNHDHDSDRITPFERRILRLVASGKHRVEIAEELRRSPQTISNVLTIAKDKLGARSIAEAAALVVEHDQRKTA